MTVLYLISMLGFGLSLLANYLVSSSFESWSEVPTTRGKTGFEVARQILDENGLENVQVEKTEGTLSDHYDPTEKVIRLSESVHDSSSIASISVAAHECGHALQDKEEYSSLVLRHNLVPILSITSGVAPILLMAGLFTKMTGLFVLGILFFSGTVLFHLVTLPVEFDASNRAKKIMLNKNMITPEEYKGTNNVLNAAAFTYVAATLVAIMELGSYLFMFFRSNDNDE